MTKTPNYNLNKIETGDKIIDNIQHLGENAEIIDEELAKKIENETDPTVPDWAKKAEKPSYTFAEIGGKPSTYTPSSHTHKKTDITDLTVPTKISDLTNDSNFISSTVVTGFWSGTQADYDAITQKNATTLYLITEE